MAIAIFILIFSSIVFAEVAIYLYPHARNLKFLMIGAVVELNYLIMDKLKNFNIDFVPAMLISIAVACLGCYSWMAILDIIINKFKWIKKRNVKAPTKRSEFLEKLLTNKGTILTFAALAITTPHLSAIQCIMDYRSENEYFVTGTNLNQIYVGKAGDLLIFKPVNLKTLAISDSIILVKNSDTKPLVLQYRKIGPLHLDFKNVSSAL